MNAVGMIALAVALIAAQTPAQAAAPKAAAKPASTRVAVYDDTGASINKKELAGALAGYPGLRVEWVKAADIHDGTLTNFDVVLFPGGMSGTQAKALGDKGRERVREFVKGGGGYVGICAGAYLATTDYAWSLGILNARVVDKEHWARGVAGLDVALTPAGKEKLGRKNARVSLRYHQGPLLAPGKGKDVTAYECWATFAGSIANHGAPEGVMKGTTAIAAGRFGKGRVVCFSPHPEKTLGQETMIGRGIVWAAGK